MANKGTEMGLSCSAFSSTRAPAYTTNCTENALLAVSLCQPLLINALLMHLQQEDKDVHHGYGLIVATALA